LNWLQAKRSNRPKEIRKKKVVNIPKCIYIALVFLFLFTSVLVLFILILICDEQEVIDFFRSVNAESSESESEDNLNPKRDKGKGRATDLEVQEQMQQTNPKRLTKSDYNSELVENKLLQEKFDLEYALTLQAELDLELENSIQDRENLDQAEVKSPSTGSEYTVYSSEIHSDDSANTKTQKEIVKHKEQLLRQGDNAKRKLSPEYDPSLVSYNKRPKSSKD